MVQTAAHLRGEGYFVARGPAPGSYDPGMSQYGLKKLLNFLSLTISGTLNELQAALGCSVDTVMLATGKRIHEFFIRSLQMDVFPMQWIFSP